MFEQIYNEKRRLRISVDELVAAAIDGYLASIPSPPQPLVPTHLSLVLSTAKASQGYTKALLADKVKQQKRELVNPLECEHKPENHVKLTWATFCRCGKKLT
jgi:hypothetical protein